MLGTPATILQLRKVQETLRDFKPGIIGHSANTAAVAIFQTVEGNTPHLFKPLLSKYSDFQLKAFLTDITRHL